MSEPGPTTQLSRLWEEHLARPFPACLRGQDVEGEDMVMLDANVAGCVQTSLSRPLDEWRRAVLADCITALDKVLPHIDGKDAIKYYQCLREMAVLALAEQPAA